MLAVELIYRKGAVCWAWVCWYFGVSWVEDRAARELDTEEHEALSAEHHLQVRMVLQKISIVLQNCLRVGESRRFSYLVDVGPSNEVYTRG